MTIVVQQGATATIKLAFTQPGPGGTGTVPAAPPTSGGSVSGTGTNNMSATLGADQQTVTITGKGVGTDTVTYTGPQGLTCFDAVHVVATTATAVSFDESTLVAG
jgi:hypothetical protein